MDDEQQRRRRNAETKPIETHDHWTKVQVQRIPNRNDFKPTMKTDVANLAEQMDENTSLRTPATSLPLVLDAEENVSKKSRVARNVLYICGEDELKFDVNEKDWPDAEREIRSSYEGAVIDRLSGNKVKTGDQRETTLLTTSYCYFLLLTTTYTRAGSGLNSAIRTRTQVTRVRAEHPSQLDFCTVSFSANAVRGNQAHRLH